MGFTQAGQAEQAVERLAEVTHGFVRGDERQARALDGLLAVQPPQAIAQGQRSTCCNTAAKPLLTQSAWRNRRAPRQTSSSKSSADTPRPIICASSASSWGAPCSSFSSASATGAAQRLAQIGLAEGAGQQLQQAQVFVGFGGDADGQVDDLAVAPVHALRGTASGARRWRTPDRGFRRTVGDGNTLAEKGRALGFTGLQAAR
jgi:hypothetical protein